MCEKGIKLDISLRYISTTENKSGGKVYIRVDRIKMEDLKRKTKQMNVWCE